jgi:hypothetical protein
MNRKFILKRRTFLRGLMGSAAVALALPPLEAMLSSHGDALAGGEPLPKRFVLFFFGNGVRLARFVPTVEGASWELTEELAPLANVRDYCSVLTDFFDPIGLIDLRYPPHHGGTGGILSGHPLVVLEAEGKVSTKFGGPSIDQVIASQIGQATYLPSLAVGVSRRRILNEGTTLATLSHKGTDEPLEPEYEPKAVFEKLIGITPQQDRPVHLRTSVLDAVSGDIARLKKRLGKADQTRLEAHLDSVGQLQKTIEAGAQACAAGVEPTIDNVEVVQGVEPLLAASKAMSDLVKMAFTCDLTRVVSFMQTPSQAITIFTDTGATTQEHLLSHDPVDTGDFVHKAVLFNMECFAYLLEGLAGTSEGDGNLLDNTCALATSECGHGYDHSLDHPMIVAGRCGGALRHPGVHYRSPNGQNTSDVLLAVARAVAPDVAEIGSGVGHSDTPSTALDPT